MLHVCFYTAGTWGAANIGLYHIRNKRSDGQRFSARIVAGLSAYASSGCPKKRSHEQGVAVAMPCHALHMRGQARQPAPAQRSKQLNLGGEVSNSAAACWLPVRHPYPALRHSGLRASSQCSGLTAYDQRAWADA